MVEGKPWTKFQEKLDLITLGKMIPPNFETLTLSKGVANIAAGGGLAVVPGINNLKLPFGKSSWGHWARYFLGKTQGGAFDGSGYVMWYDRGDGHIGRFALCQHKKKEGAGANPRRGWHPGYCSLCGLNMTVDSGD